MQEMKLDSLFTHVYEKVLYSKPSKAFMRINANWLYMVDKHNANDILN